MTQASASVSQRDIKVITLIGVAHSFSHFYQLVLPPIFLLLKIEFDVSYTELGALATIFFVTSGLAQAAAGFVVDRLGARSVLYVGLGLLAGSVLLMGLAPSFWFLMPLSILAGLGNSVFHPADYSILTASVSERRIGRAYGVHTFGGALGWAAAPAVMVPLAQAYGWRVALIAVGLAGLAVLAVLISQSATLHHEAVSHEVRRAAPSAASILLSRPVMLSFVYFLFLSLGTSGLQNFLPTALGALHGKPLEVGGQALTAYLLGSATGVLIGGIMADRNRQHGLVVAIGLSFGIIATLIVGEMNLPDLLLMVTLALGGLVVGVTMPSRDMLVRSATPKGASGRVFGFVYSGLDAGGAISPLLIGLLLDHGEARIMFWFLAVMLFGAVVAALSVRRWVARRARV